MDNSVGSRALKEHREKISGKPTGDKNV